MNKRTVQETAELLNQNPSTPLIDVRTPAEFGSVRAKGAVNHAMESLDLNDFPFSRDQELFLICQSGGRSMKVCQKLEDAGFEKVTNAEGGTSAWQAAGLPLIEGKKRMSLEHRYELPRVPLW